MPAFLLADIPPLQCLKATSQVSVVSFQLSEMSLEKMEGKKKHIRSVSIIIRLTLVRLHVKPEIILWLDSEKFLSAKHSRESRTNTAVLIFFFFSFFFFLNKQVQSGDRIKRAHQNLAFPAAASYKTVDDCL